LIKDDEVEIINTERLLHFYHAENNFLIDTNIKNSKFFTGIMIINDFKVFMIFVDTNKGLIYVADPLKNNKKEIETFFARWK
jgi:hypothetical protein